MYFLCLVLTFWNPEGMHILSVFIPVFIDNMTVVFTHRHLGIKGCHVTWVTTISLRERLTDDSSALSILYLD